MRHRVIVWLSHRLAFPLFLTAAALLGAPDQPAAQETRGLKIGAALSLTGQYAKEGRWVKDGYDFWAKHVNARGGIKAGGAAYRVEMVYYDDQSDAKTAAQLTEKLITEDKVRFVLGPYGSSATQTASAVSERYRVLMVEANGASAALFERGFKHLFAVLSPAEEYLAGALRMAMAQTPQPQTVAVIWENTLFAVSAAESALDLAKKLGLRVVYRQQYPPDTKDLSSVITALRAGNPDVLLCAGTFNQSVLVTRQARDLNFNPKILQVMTGPGVPEFVTNLGADAEGIVGPVQWYHSMSYKDPVFGSSEEFTRAFEKAYGYLPTYHVAQSAAAGEILQLAIEKAGTLETEKVREALARMDVQTFYGPIKFDAKGRNLAKPMALVQVQGGSHVVVWPDTAAKARPLYPKPAWATKK